jgi:hypothetical protein
VQQLFSAGAYGGISHAKGTAHSRYVVISVAFLWLLEPASLSGFLLISVLLIDQPIDAFGFWYRHLFLDSGSFEI